MIKNLNKVFSKISPNKIKIAISQNQKALLIFIGLLIFASLVYTIYKINYKSRQEKFSSMLHEAMVNNQIGDIEKAKNTLKEIHDSSHAPSGIKSMASMRYAGMLFEEGKKDEAVKIYLEVNNCGSCDQYIKDLAGLIAARVLTTDEKELAKDDISARIEKIENNAKILKYYIAEQRATVEMLKNNFEKSYQIFDMISKNPEVNNALKERAKDAMKIVAQKKDSSSKDSAI